MANDLSPDIDLDAEAAAYRSRRVEPVEFGTKSSLSVFRWGEVANFEPPRWLLKGLLAENSLSVLWGEPGAGKSFLALDMAAHVALGWPWRGVKCNGGAVVYLGLEGARGLRERILAFQKHNNVHDDGEAETPFYLVLEPLDLMSPDGDLTRTVNAINDCGKVKLVVVDTLARAMVNGDENNGHDMSAFIRNMDRIRHGTGAHVMIIHHGGKDQTRGARGHSSLKAAVDAEIELRKPETGGPRLARMAKQRDGEEGQEYAFQLEVVDLGEDEDGDPITSCVCVPVQRAESPAGRRRQVTGSAAILLAAIRESIEDAGSIPPGSNHIPSETRCVNIDLARRYAYRRGITDTDNAEAKKKAFSRALKRLQNENMVAQWGEWIWPT